mgnify:FL=1
MSSSLTPGVNVRAKILSPTPENLTLVAQAILRGEVVGMPTETVYGLAGDCRSPLALTRIFETKERPTFDPLIVHLGSIDPQLEALVRLKLVDAAQITTRMEKQANRLMEKFWPGPLTLILPKHFSIPDLVTSGLPSVALRMPRHPVAQSLLNQVQTPLAAPSANRFGRISPTSAQAVLDELGDRIHWILEGGPSQIGVESTVIALTQPGKIRLLRPGGTPAEAIEELLGESLILPSSSPPPPGGGQLGPGMTESHYAPEKPFCLLPRKVSELTPADFEQLRHEISQIPYRLGTLGLLLLGQDPEALGQDFSRALGYPVVSRTLSLMGELSEAAQNLFSEMRYLDTSKADLIFCEPCTSKKGLGFAISDRLKRASAIRKKL